MSLSDNSPYTSTNKTNKNIYIYMYINETIQKNTVQTIQNTLKTRIHITKTPTHYKTHAYTHRQMTNQVKTTTVRDTQQVK